jgi:hypothetical protein
MMNFVRQRVTSVLNGEDKSGVFAPYKSRSRIDRAILVETKPGFLMSSLRNSL